MWTEMGQIVTRASNDPGVRVIVLSSTTDKTFTGGLDLTDGGALSDPRYSDPARKAFALHEHVIDFQNAISTLANCRPPVIAALHGAALGLAIDIASACDIRLAAENSSFGIVEINVGLAADIGTLQRFPKIVGNDSIARELALTGRKFGAAEAKEMGFVSRVVKGGRGEVVASALEMAKLIAEKSPVAAVSTKHLMNHARDHTVRDGLEYTAAWNM
ncbi:ClpP/crotonase-like domain-containing protein [Dioszegia hungarica]|uniref:ClpP/crotonase-like domain-containing protein n=1 Tax=Dioszegia hungarica TaxID=4972 RepID=A0AA38H3C2_9TREE|nr:ClpP/crotonase-like domain-containing protein [Dioszegia hungarica]KAI9631976.1 ClpP/crotonase-like domain-containing protein [Dioszegia hungarica]